MSNPWFRFSPTSHGADPNKLKLCVFHHAGGSSTSFAKWKNVLPQNIELALVELPGRGMRYREPTIETFEKVITELSQAFEAEIHGQVILAGHSFGALIAFELFRALKPERARDVRGIMVSSFSPPLQEHLDGRKVISHLPEPEFLSEISRYAELPRELMANAMVKDYFLEVLRRDIHLIETYQNRNFSKSDVRMLVCGGLDDRAVPPENLNGWSQFAKLTGPPLLFEGDHFYIQRFYPQIIRAMFSAFY